MIPRELIDKHLSEDLSDADARVLAEWLREDRDHVKEFVRATHVHAALPDVLEEDVLEGMGASRQPFTADRLWGMRPVVPFAAAAVLAIGVLLGVATTRLQRGGRRIVGRVLETSRNVTIERGGRKIAAKTGIRLCRGDRVTTGASQRFTFMCERDRARVDMMDETALEIWGSRDGGLALERGCIDADVKRRFGGRRFAVETPHAKVDVLGTSFRLLVSTGATRLDMETGVARLTHLAAGTSREVYEWGYGFVREDLDLLVFPPKGRTEWVKTVKKLRVDLPAPRGPGIAFDGSALWLTANDPPKLFEIDPESGAIVKELDVSKDFRRIGNMTWDGERLVVSGELRNTDRGSEMCALDSSNGKIIEKLICPDQLKYVSSFKSVTRKGGFLWAVLPQGGRVDRVELETGVTRGSFYIHHPEIRALAYEQDAFWTAGEKCLYKMDPSDLTIVDFYRNSDACEIRDIVGAGAGRLWLAGVTGDLALVDVNQVSGDPFDE